MIIKIVLLLLSVTLLYVVLALGSKKDTTMYSKYLKEEISLEEYSKFKRNSEYTTIGTVVVIHVVMIALVSSLF